MMVDRAIAGCYGLVEEIIIAGGDAGFQHDRPLPLPGEHRALTFGDEATQGGYTLLHVLAGHWDVDPLQADLCSLLQAMCQLESVNVNARCREGGFTPLHLASASRNHNTVAILLRYGADASLDTVSFYFGHQQGL